MKKSQGQKVYEYMCRPEYTPETAIKIMNTLGFSIKSDARLTELKQAGYITSRKVEWSDGAVFEVIDKKRAYNHLDIVAIRKPKQKRGDTVTNQLEAMLGKIMIKVGQLNWSTQQKQEFLNTKVFPLYSLFYTNRKDVFIFFVELKIINRDLDKTLDEISVKI